MCTEIPAFESSSVLHISPTYTSSMQELLMQEMSQKVNKNPAFHIKRTLFYSLQNAWLSLLIGLNTQTTM